MAGDHLHVRRQACHYILEGIDQSPDGTARRQVDKGKSYAQEIVAHVDYVRLRKVNNAVSIRVAILKMHHLDIFIVQMNHQVMVEGQDGQYVLRLRAGSEDERSAVA